MIHLLLRMQEVVIFLSAVIIGFFLSTFLSFIYDFTPEKIDRITTKKGYHVHHSMFGLTSFLVTPIMIDNHHVLTTVVLIGLGLGIILEHTIQCGFIFITKAEDN